MKILLWIVLVLFYIRTIGDVIAQFGRYDNAGKLGGQVIIGLIIGFSIDVTAAVLATMFVRGL